MRLVAGGILTFHCHLKSYFTQVCRFGPSKPRKQSFCSNVSLEICWKDLGVSHKFAYCDSSWWLFIRQSNQPYSSVPKQQVILLFLFFFQDKIVIARQWIPGSWSYLPIGFTN